MTDALKLAEAVTDRLMEAHDLSLSRDQVDVGVARWTGRSGVFKCNKRLDTKRFGERMSKLPREHGNHVIVINERILEDGNRAGFIDTIQHELAHAACYADQAKYPSRGNGPMSPHGRFWKRMARTLGADPTACHNLRDRSEDFSYYVNCPNCGKEYGRTKRSKIVKQPFTRECGECGHSPLSSYESGQRPPQEGGVVRVESLPWSNKSEWFDKGCP